MTTTSTTATSDDKQDQDYNHRERSRDDYHENSEFEREYNSHRGSEYEHEDERGVDHRNREHEHGRSTEGAGLPNEFKNMDNLYEVAYWVATHPDVHHLADEIREGLGTRHVRGVSTRPPTNDAQVRTSSILCKRYGF